MKLAGAALAVLTLSFAGCALAPRAEESILSVIREQEQAWNCGDIEGYMLGYANRPSTSFASGDKLTRGWQETLDRYRQGYDTQEKMGTLEFADLRVELIASDAAIVTGKWALARKQDRPHGLFTLLFRKLNEGWRIVHDHTSAAKS